MLYIFSIKALFDFVKKYSQKTYSGTKHSGRHITKTLNRDELVLAQTPQLLRSLHLSARAWFLDPACAQVHARTYCGRKPRARAPTLNFFWSWNRRKPRARAPTLNFFLSWKRRKRGARARPGAAPHCNGTARGARASGGERVSG